ncbi:Rieske (2Fe-2S) protein [Actinomadura keratinilytica]|jgi:nitrite reductase/ring-hydroxylating ferredoxin subunit|uniref:Rieske domain-containing protein n=1 Tax=Actinomadura keratinilytica TaxID=547461 RepID=A0ABP7Z5Z3_9ACTN
MAQEPAPRTGHGERAAEEGSSRRGVLFGVGLAGAAGVLAACGGSGDSDGGASGTAGGGALAQASEIPVGGGKVFKAQKVVVTQPQQGQFKAFDVTCPHRGCPVDAVSGGTINCPCHGSKFDINDGSVVSGPSDKGLTAKQINVQGGQITLA